GPMEDPLEIIRI
uniref:Conorfamide-Sr2 n=1 Tax=Conus spurius TaxID=192919 RepID=CRFA2_CONSP|nr:RecName: Full=Conorfamide-Sr2; Short=CNF-Sr2; AltName: Full=Cono-RFamide-Sr2 [Conus spurius]